jgi:DNA-binding transcriptional LysR family regulator
MSTAEWLRTFTAVYRTGAVTAGARVRGISQPAASQQLAALSRAVGAPLLTRTKDGVVPTARGRELYAQVAESLDRLETVLAGLDGGRLPPAPLRTRIGCSADLFDGYVLPRLAGRLTAVTADFSTDQKLMTKLLLGELDLVLTLIPPSKRTTFDTRVIGERRFVLVGAPNHAPAEPLRTPAELATWLTGRPWVSYSHELPITRTFWATHLGKAFDAEVRLVAPDLRSVASAVQLGVGASLLPDHACRRQLDDGSLVEIYRPTPPIAGEAIHAVNRRSDAARTDLLDLVQALADRSRTASSPAGALGAT